MDAWEPLAISDQKLSKRPPDAIGAKTPVTATVADIAPVTCPSCGRALVVWVRATRRLHGLTRDGYLGYPLGADHRAQVPIGCEPCGRRWAMSGREVAQAMYEGRPPLAG